jgi:site-specific DNA recombinase
MGSRTETKPPRGIGYTRRSQHRENGFGLNDQGDSIRKWGAYTDTEIIEIIEIIEDDATSGVIDPSARDGLGRALELLRSGEASILVAAKFDRLARSIIGFAELLKLSEAEGWTIVVLEPQLDLRTAAGRAMASMLIAFADIEREAFRDRMQGGRRAKATRGGYTGGQRLHPRFGFKLVQQDDGALEYEPAPEQQATIDRIVEMRDTGQTLGAIAQTLEAEGIAAPSGGQRWHEMTISRIARTVVAA